MVDRPLSLSLNDLKRNFSRIETAVTLQCAGNRRDELMTLGDVPNEIVWGSEAISHAAWAGVPLNEVLQEAHIADDAEHIGFLGLDNVQHDAKTFHFGGSIPIEKAADTLLAYDMNGESLPPVHGYPLRAIVPGYIGARSVKWLSVITALPAPSNNYYQARGYKLFPPEVTAETADPDAGEMLGQNGVNSVVCDPRPGQVIPAGAVRVKGYALAGTSSIARVEVSTDGGRNWVTATLSPESGSPYSWRLWWQDFDLPAGAYQLVVRAWDSHGGGQPEKLEQVWNFKGYANNAYHRIHVTCK